MIEFFLYFNQSNSSQLRNKTFNFIINVNSLRLRWKNPCFIFPTFPMKQTGSF